MNDVDIDEAAVSDLLDSDTGPVGRLLDEMTGQIVTVARAKVRVRVPGTDRTGITSDARAPGATLASIHTRMGHRSDGTLWASANADFDPGIFLEKPAEQLHREYPFLTAGADSLEATF